MGTQPGSPEFGVYEGLLNLMPTWVPFVGALVGAAIGGTVALTSARKAGLREHRTLDDIRTSAFGSGGLTADEPPAKKAEWLGVVVGGVVGLFAPHAVLFWLFKHPIMAFAGMVIGAVSGWKMESPPIDPAFAVDNFSQLPKPRQDELIAVARTSWKLNKVKSAVVGLAIGFVSSFGVYLLYMQAFGGPAK